MIRWSEHIFWLGLSSELFWKNFTLDIVVGVDVSDVQSDSVSHFLSIHVISLSFFVEMRIQVDRILVN